MFDELKTQIRNKLSVVINNLEKKFLNLRVGRIDLSIFDNVKVNYYDSLVSINQVASIVSPEYNQIIIKPYDNSCLKSIVSAINNSNLDLVPNIDGDKIRIIIPSLTEETRKNIVKKAKQITEDSKIMIRNIRHEFINFIKDKKDYSDDFKKKIQDEIQKDIDEYNLKINKIFSTKEKEIMTF